MCPREPDGGTLDAIWDRDIRPRLIPDSAPDPHPTTVFLGGQPAAGKTSGGDLARLAIPGILAIEGDSFRKYHPHYDHILGLDRVRMAEVTAKAAGYWTGRAVTLADDMGLSSLIEGTWRNSATVLDEAARAKRLGRATWAMIVATPPAFSRVGIVSRYLIACRTRHDPRWTPPEAHDEAVRRLPGAVPEIAGSGLIDRFTVVDRDGAVLADGRSPADRAAAARRWREAFDRPLTAEERRRLASTIGVLNRWADECGEWDPRVRSAIRDAARPVADPLPDAWAAPELGDESNGRWVQNRGGDGRYRHGGHWE